MNYNKQMHKKKYQAAAIAMIDVETMTGILAASIINVATVEATGQEIGAEYDMSKEGFNHEWE